MKTFAVRSVSGGLHLYFKTHDRLKGKTKMNRDRYDIIHEASYIMSAGSQVKLGGQWRSYTALNYNEPQPLPLPLLEFICEGFDKSKEAK